MKTFQNYIEKESFKSKNKSYFAIARQYQQLQSVTIKIIDDTNSQLNACA